MFSKFFTNHSWRNILQINLSLNKKTVSLCVFSAAFATSCYISNFSSGSRSLHKSDLKLLSAGKIIPHPEKVSTGGEDAFYIAPTSIGVFDGVGGWRLQGVDSGIYSKALAQHCLSSYDPSLTAEEVLSNGLKRLSRTLLATRKNSFILGSTTALILTVNDSKLNSITVGDSGFLLIRNNKIVHRSDPSVYGFNFPHQFSKDTLSLKLGKKKSFYLTEGDIIIVGSDGLFDNLYDDEIKDIVCKNKKLTPEHLVEILANKARERSADETYYSPFSAAAAKSGYSFFGGKVDDITVVVSKVILRPLKG